MTPRLVSHEELEEYRTLTDSFAKVAIELLKRGVSSEDMAKTFASLLLIQFEANLTDEVIAILPRNGHGQPAVNLKTAVFDFSTDFALAFMKTITEKTKNRHVSV